MHIRGNIVYIIIPLLTYPNRSIRDRLTPIFSVPDHVTLVQVMTIILELIVLTMLLLGGLLLGWLCVYFDSVLDRIGARHVN